VCNFVAYVFSLMSALPADSQNMGWKPMRRTAKMAVPRGDFAWLNTYFVAHLTGLWFDRLTTLDKFEIQMAQ
jgi:hypothetical protein